jgi:hypothetical protein
VIGDHHAGPRLDHQTDSLKIVKGVSGRGLL